MPSFSFSPFPELRSSHGTGGHIGIQDIYTCPEELHELPPMNGTSGTVLPSHNNTSVEEVTDRFTNAIDDDEEEEEEWMFDTSRLKLCNFF